jgi:hypothetical protein
MSPRDPDLTPLRASRPRWQRLALVVVALAVLGAAGAGAWYLFLRPAAPAAVGLGTLPTATPAIGLGELSLHGQTNAVEVALEARLSGGTGTVVGSLPIFFGDYGIPTPESMRVLSIDQNGTMEFQLHFTRA